MLRELILICACLRSIPALCQSAGSAKYQIATLVAVNPHSSDTASDSSAPGYDLSVQIGNTIYSCCTLHAWVCKLQSMLQAVSF